MIETVLFSGLLDLPWWGYVIAALALSHVTIAAVTIFLHRHQAHRALDLHPVVSHFFRLWLWLTTGMVTKEWAAIHRKHHARCETAEDPHSPQVHGINKVLWLGVFLYVKESFNKETMDRFGHGTPDDWMERNVYSRHAIHGLFLMGAVNIALFGLLPGMLILLTQIVWIPFWAAGVINGVGHWFGYRSYDVADASTNIVPWGILIGGEELHNNHHAFPTSARFSMRRHEVDMGWLHLKALVFFGLAKIRRVASTPELEQSARSAADLDELRAIMVNRMHVLRAYMQRVTLPVLRREAEGLGDNTSSLLRAARKALIRHPQMLDERSRKGLAELAARHPRFETVLQFRNELRNLWEGAHPSNERLLADFREWCARAEQSGIQGLQDFVAYLKSFRAMRDSALGLR
jgi:stearoyl-CoA desaturase (delta-9 desaturase)